MTRLGLISTGFLAAFLAAGCTEVTPGRTRSLGEVDYALAFATGQEVLSQYYSVQSAEVNTGVITARPKPVKAGNDRLLGGYPARQVARMRIRREGRSIVAQVSVAVQRQRSQMRRQMQQVGDNYDSVPNKTPAEDQAATTIEQNENWEVRRYAHEIEAKILDDLYKALHPDGKK